MIQTNGSHAVTNVSITKQHGMCCHFFHLVFQKGLSCFHFTGGKCSERPTYRGCRRVAKEGEIEEKSLRDSTERCSWFLTSFRCLTVTLQDIVNFQNLSLLCGTSKSSSTLLQKFVCVFFFNWTSPLWFISSTGNAQFAFLFTSLVCWLMIYCNRVSLNWSWAQHM